MDRRTCLQGIFAAGIMCGCGIGARLAQAAKFAARGCRPAAASGADTEERPARVRSSGDNVTDLLVRAHADTAYFGVHPGFVFIDDAGAPNAYADQQSWLADKPDGTVLLGVGFLAEVRRLQQGQTSFYNENSFFIVLHEMAHILQFKRGMAGRADWQMEPHADFMAGWAYARHSPKSEAWVRENLELGVQLMFGLGDTDFNDPQHHGQPELRAAMVRAGYDSAALDLDAAFEHGKRYAGLR
jgi:hypothetical protein